MTSTTRVAGAHKAALKNPRVPEEAKEHSREVLEELGEDVRDEKRNTRDEKVPDNRARGFKATFSNPRASEEAKQHAREVLTIEFDPEKWIPEPEKDEARVLAGYKATLHNPRVSESEKEKAPHVLDEHGAI